jgi:hypothetical protein
MSFGPRAFAAMKRSAFAKGEVDGPTDTLPGTNVVLAASALQAPVSSPAANAKTSSKPSTGFVVTAGVRAAAPADDEERLRRSIGSGGAGERERGGAKSGFLGSANPLDAGMRSPSSRTAIDKTRGLAMGSQAAVIKLASFASGRSRIGALVRYQSRDGEIPLEREDGGKVEGVAALDALVTQWAAETAGQEPSKDVLFFTATISDVVGPDAVRTALGNVLSGHKHAWRIEEDDGRTRVHVVSSAASEEHDDAGRSRRLFDNNKSIATLHDRIELAFNGKVEFEERGWAHGTEGVARYLSRLTRDGRTPGVTSTGQILDSHDGNLVVAASWKRALRSREPRDTAHIILSAKAGTPREAFVDAARATLAREFAGHKYAFALHTDKRHVHVHAIVRMDNARGGRLHPNIGDFQRWRTTLAEEARHRLIPMEEIKRFEQANGPAYKLKDVAMAERDDATPAQHQRLRTAGRTWNAAKGAWEETERGVHVPSRMEGRRRANDSAQQWQAVSRVPLFGAEPPTVSDASRLYRVENSATQPKTALLFTRDRAKAEAMATTRDATLCYIDVPNSRRSEIKPSRSAPTEIFVVSAALATERRDIPRQSDDRVRISATGRVRRAAIEGAGAEIDRLGKQLGNPAMRTAENLTATRTSLEALFNEALPHLPEEDRAGWSRQKTDMLAAADKLIATNRRIEANRPNIQGETFDAPGVRDVGSTFVPELKGGEVHYSRRNAETDKVEVAFVDRGDRVDIHDWTRRDSILAAMKLSSQKWDAITVNGSASYKTAVVELAVEHGFAISNPELQDKVRIEHERVARQRETDAPTVQRRVEAKGAESVAGSEGAIHVASPSPSPPLAATPGETQIALDQVRAQTEREAALETRQATEARRLGETTAATGTAEHPYRSGQEARTARDAAHAMENNPGQPTPAEPGQSEKVEELAREQRSYLEQAKFHNEEEAARSRRDDKSHDEER